MEVADDCSSEEEDDMMISFVLDRNPRKHQKVTEEGSTAATIPKVCRTISVYGLFEIVPADILSAIFSGWLTITDLSRLDIAVCNAHSRCAYIDSLKWKGSAHYGSERPYGNDYIAWLSKRSILVRHFRGHKSFLTRETIKDINDHWSVCWSELTHLDLRYCAQMTPRLALQIASLSSKLILLNLSTCRITDSELLRVSSALSCLQCLCLMGNKEISDKAIITVAQNCPLLQSLDLSFCQRISEFGLLEIFNSLPLLINLRLRGLDSFTNKALVHLSKKCSYIESLDLLHCENISLTTLLSSSRLWPLHSLDLPYQHTVADIGLILEIATYNDSLTNLNVLHYPTISVSLMHRYPYINFYRTSKSALMNPHFSIEENV
jgi:hypothetical protein